MNNEQVDKLAELLHKLKNEALSYDISACIKSEKSADDLDNAVADNQAALTTKLYARQSAYLKKIDEALKKIEDGTFGQCSACGDDISYKRLLARPAALLCVLCKEEQEHIEQKEKDKLRGGFLADME